MGATEHHARVERVHEWFPGTRSLFLRVEAGDAFAFVPGQFLSFTVPSGGVEPLARPYSLASDPEDAGRLEICVDRVPGGAASAWLFDLAVGAPLAFTGPFGSFALDVPPAAPLVFVAHGTGMAPIRPMVRRALARGGAHPVDLIESARIEPELLWRDEMAALADAHRRFRWEPVFGAPDAGTGLPASLVARVLAAYVDGDADRIRRFWICGVGDEVRRLRDALRTAGYERRAVRAEQW